MQINALGKNKWENAIIFKISYLIKLFIWTF